MNLKQAKELESQRLKKEIEVDYPEVLVDISEYQEESDALGASLTESDLNVKTQAKINDINTDTVDTMKYTMADTIESLLVRARSKAKGDKNLLKLLKNPFSYYYYAPKEVAVQRGEAIEELLIDKKAVFVNLLPADYTLLHKVITDYSESKEIPKEKKQEKKAAGTSALALSIKTGTARKNTMADLLISTYKTKNPKIAERARLAVKTEAVGGHITGSYEVVDFDTLLPLVNPVFTETFTTKKGKVKVKRLLGDTGGLLAIKTHRPGNVSVLTEVADYLTVSSVFQFKKNGENQFVVRMKKK